MRIVSLAEVKRPRGGLFDLFVPQILGIDDYSKVNTYVVQKEQDMRLDLIMLEMYDQDYYCLEHMDIICFINNLDNPLNVYPGMVLYYPPISEFDYYRLKQDNTNNSSKIKAKLAVPNKTTQKDSNRKKYVENGYSLPPVVLNTPKEPVRLSGTNIEIGGL